MRLIDEISFFLKENGFESSVLLRHGFDVICTRTAGCTEERIILPLEIESATEEEAARAGEEAFECIRFIRSSEGYPLIITEDRWHRQKEMTQARLLAHLEVFTAAYARNCEIRRIEKAEAQEFLNRNHSYGDAACKYRYGLFLKRHTGHIAAEMGFPIGSGMTDEKTEVPDREVKVPDGEAGTYSSPVILKEVKNPSRGTLIAVATFSNARKWIKDGKEIRSYEWTRYASLPDLRVSGGMGKMLKAFIKEVQPDDIMSYADLEWSEGEVYERLGFEAETRKEPVTFIINPQTWERKAIRRSPVKLGITEGDNVIPDQIGDLFFRNFGSRKFRLKLTDYR